MEKETAPITPSENFAQISLERLLTIWHRCEVVWNAQAGSPEIPEAFLPMVMEAGSLRAQMRLKRAADSGEPVTFGKRKVPAVGQFVRGIGRLVSVDDGFVVPKEVSPLNYVFEEQSAEVRTMKGEFPLQSGGSYNDFYGEGRSTVAAIEEARGTCRRLGITAASELEVIVVRTLTQTRKQISLEENLADKEHTSFTSLGHGSHWDVKPPRSEIVWSSKRDLIPVDESATSAVQVAAV